jgi:hypothetical protein
LIENPLLFLHGVACVQSVEVERDIDWEPLLLYTGKRTSSLAVRAFGSKPLASIGDALLVG